MPASRVLSIVCPAYQEEEVLPLFHSTLVEAIEPLGVDFEIEILYVDDGSRDGTLDVIRQLAANDARIRYVSLSRNFGHQAALTAGLEHSRGDAVVTLDSDLQHPPALIPELVARWRDRFDVVLTIRSDDGRLSWFKRTSSRLFYRILAMCSNLDVRASASDFRLMSRPAVDALLKLKESHRYVRGMVQWLGFRVAEVPFTPDARKAGISKYTLRRMVRFALDGLLSFSPAPIRVTVGAGLALGFLTWILCIGLAFVSLSRTDPTTYLVAAGITAVHFLGAFLLAALGVIGEYVYRIYEQVKGRPVYIVKETTTNTSNVSLTATRSPAKAA